ncbi:MAG: T9SS type A sorting domain-containing protein [Candidatus Tenebribacter burtonii]|jgi:hypothetical protein|nr:T9SS type A sorting domain-containing protein [Candidatus Tenebribacter burtonii]
MIRILLTILLILFIQILESQISFNLDITLNRVDLEDEVVNISIRDFDDNGQEEIWVNYVNLDDNYSIELWRLVSYDLEGEILSIYTEYCTPERQLTKCYLFEWDDTRYLIEVYNENINEFCSCIIEMYNFDSNVLLDSEVIEIGETYGVFGYCFNTRYVTIKTYENSCYIYLGLLQGDEGDENGYWGSEMYKFLFDQNSLNLVENIPEGGSKLLKYEENDFLIAFGEGGSWNYPSFYSVSNSINSVTQNSPAVVEEIFSISSNDYQYLTYLTRNDSNYPDYGLLIYITPNYNFVCFSPDFSEILWENSNPGINQIYISTSTCVNTNLGDYFILYFYKDLSQQPYCEVRNRVTGNVALTQESDILPFSINRRSDNELLFFTDNETQINVYSLSEEIQVSADNNQISMAINDLQNYPNPFNPTTTISFSIQNESNVELSIYNTKGQKVKILSHNEFDIGYHSIVWNGDDDSNKPVSSGIYFYKLNVNGKTVSVKKCLLLK